uniref:Uncharacterized protein n=1 Tax=Octopus bimaculoides TaxID=37653 RepID=A0A0L8FUA0_OCTBM
MLPYMCIERNVVQYLHLLKPRWCIEHLSKTKQTIMSFILWQTRLYEYSLRIAEY